MDLLVNVEPFQTMNDAEARAIRGRMIQELEAVKRIEDEIARLVENKRKLEEGLVRLGAALAPHNHRLLPSEVLSHIFILLALGYGTVRFPIPKNNAPPQLVVSHICSSWRRVALRTPELWSNTHLIFPTYDHLGDHNHIRVCFHQRWVSRARTLPVTLSISFSESLCSAELLRALRNILLPIQVKRLSLCLTYKKIMTLSTLPEAALSGLSECEVKLKFPDHDVNMSDPHPLITRLRSVTFCGHEVAGAGIDQLRPSLPWSQLRSLKFETNVRHLEDTIIGILRQIPMLEVLTLPIFNIGVWEQLTMPSLRNLTMRIFPEVSDLDIILRSFMCPSLTQFTFAFFHSWTCETFKILKQQYNMEELREVTIMGAFVLPVSSLLRGAPMLHSLILRQNTAIDEEAFMGISNGTLGRFLRSLEIHAHHDAGEVLDMVETRKKTVDGLIEKGCSWREEITSLEEVKIYTYTLDGKDYEERIIELEEAGIYVNLYES
jgi:hypothetical protein